jgi:hypothetical protein
MKRMLAALTLAMLLALVVVTVVASASQNDQLAKPPNDFTTGAGMTETTTGLFTIEEKFAFSAQDEDDNPANSAARNGHFVYQRTTTSSVGTTEFDVKGSVDCVRVVGNRAGFSGPIEKSSSSPHLEGLLAVFSVADNDQPPSSGVAPDEFRFFGPSPFPGCFPAAGTPITSGNILVHDAQ